MRMSSSLGSGGAMVATGVSAAAPLDFFDGARLRGELVGDAGVRFAMATFQTAMFSAPGGRASSVLVGRVAVVEPRLGGVRVAADFPEAFLIFGQKFDLADPLRAFPRVQLWRDHPAGTAVLARQRRALPRVYQQHVVFDGAGEWKIRRVWNVRAGHEVVADAEHVRRVALRHGTLGDRTEPHALPVIVVT